MSVEDKQAAGILPQASSKRFQQDAAAAVAQILGPSTSALVEISVKCKGLPNRDVLRCVMESGGRAGPKAARRQERLLTACHFKASTFLFLALPCTQQE